MPSTLRSGLQSGRIRALPFLLFFGCLALLVLSSSLPAAWTRSKFAAKVEHGTSHPSPPSASFSLPEDAPVVNPPNAVNPVNQLYARQSKTFEEAVTRYSLRNGRAPPPNFDKWFQFAQNHSCLIDEYDQIRRDFEPFYRLAEKNPWYFQTMVDLGRELMLKDPGGMVTIKIENGAVKMPNYTGSAWDPEWPATLSAFAHLLPDVEFLINGRDEPRVVFNTHDPDIWPSAGVLQDHTPFHVTPVPSSEFFKNRSECKTLKVDGTGQVDALEDVAFIRSASNTDFTTDLWPILSMTKIPGACFADILFPGQYYYNSSAWSGKFGVPSDISWEDKQPILYWRGSSNGGRIIHDNYHAFSRFRLIKIAESRPDIIDARLIRVYGPHCTVDCELQPILEEYNIKPQYIRPREEIYQFKYLLDVDGNTFSGRYLGLLRSGSLVFKATAFEEYFSDWIRPWEHYVPVHIGLGDLVEKVEWAMSHEEEARAIQRNGQEFAQRVMTDEQNACYFALVLLEWARLQGYAKAGSNGDL
ncbi:CAP10 domain-containing protein [Mycena chlorophos]|uniref:CAP10 domain-containing protein n=1 Tax=Mycena chlorophos TaxID=658473 RepID=A0A8H6THP5_MYCCL|nr:CAP10 domain-containing protein [Mycena chlorophos]